MSSRTFGLSDENMVQAFTAFGSPTFRSSGPAPLSVEMQAERSRGSAALGASASVSFYFTDARNL